MAPPAGVKPGVIKDPAIAALFSNKDPESRFDDLREIGHGSFGAVFFAFDKERSETVAIKKMAYTGKTAVEKWTDILKEVSFLNKIKHRHIVEYKACFLKDHTCWLVMEYCIGSAADIVDVLRQGLREVEIAVICAQTLDALQYLHSMNRIHRDIKAGNILLSDHAIVKLADFGSASMADPAHTFIGTPFFMAPEVILAMDEGCYTEKADLWSLGITCIELAERRPPLFNMNTMSALYHIAQNDPPVLAPVEQDMPQWSSCFVSFIEQCLRKDPDQRVSTAACCVHPFVTAARPRDTIHELINRTKAVVMELDNFQYKKMRKLMYLDEAEGREYAGGGDDDSDDIPSNMDALSVGQGNDSTSSRSASSLKSLTSFRSIQSASGGGGASTGRRPPIPLNMRNDLNQTATLVDSNRTLIPVGGDTSIDSERDEQGGGGGPPSPTPPVRSERNIKDDMQTLRKSKFSTLRSAKLISREQEEYSKENNMYEQMSGYKRLRQGHHKELQQLEERCAADIELLRVRLDRELDSLSTTHGKEQQRVSAAHKVELDKKAKEVAEGEKKLKKQIATRQQREMAAFCAMQLKEYKHNKELNKANLKELGLSRSQYDQRVKDTKARLNAQKRMAEADFQNRLESELSAELGRYRRETLALCQALEQRLEEEELNILERQQETRQALVVRHHETTKEMEGAQQREVHAMKKRHQEIQHEAESSNQCDYNRRLTDSLRKKHAMQSRQQPRELKLKETQIRKQYRQAVKTQTRQFKLWQTQMMQAAPRDEQKDISARLKEEQKRKIALLASQYENQIENMVQEKTVKLESWQEDEAKHLSDRLAKELDELSTYQRRQRQQLEDTIAKERTALSDRISLRLAVLQQRNDEERHELSMVRERRRSALLDRHSKEKERELGEGRGGARGGGAGGQTTAL